VIVKAFNDPHECLAAHKIVSKKLRLNDHKKNNDHKQLLKKFQKVVSEQLEQSEQFFKKSNDQFGHQASPHDRMTITDLLGLGLEIDRFHLTCVIPNLYLSLVSETDEPFQPIKRSYDFGTITVYTSDIVDLYLDLSDELLLAQAEGVIGYFLKISGHRGHVKFQLHDHEFTIKIPYEHIIAKRIKDAFGGEFATAFIRQTVKIYPSKDHIRIEGQHINDTLLTVDQFYRQQLGPGIHVVAFGQGNQQVLQKLDSINHKVDVQTEGINALIENTKELNCYTQDLKQELELSREQQREQFQRTETKIDEVKEKIEQLDHFSYRTTIFDKRCNAIKEALKEHEFLTQKEIAEKLNIKQQGIKRYLDTLKKKQKIEEGKLVQGIGRPKKIYRILKPGEEFLPKEKVSKFGKIVWREDEGEEPKFKK